MASEDKLRELGLESGQPVTLRELRERLQAGGPGGGAALSPRRVHDMALEE